MKEQMMTSRALKWAWIKFAIGAGLLVTAGSLSGCDDEFFYVDCPEPHAPVGVYSVTGDEEVTLYWIPVDEDYVDDFVVYRSRTPGGRYHEVGHTGRDYFVDRTVDNGKTYFYAVAAVGPCGYESELSWEVAQDTPRPEGGGIRLADANSEDWRRSAWDFDSYRVVPWDSPNADIYFVFSDGLPFLVAADLHTDIQDAGFGGFDDVDWAPDGGWSPSGTVEVIEGHLYVIWTRDNHYAKVRVVSASANRVEFDWAYQVDHGNPELKPRQRTESGPAGGRRDPGSIS